MNTNEEHRTVQKAGDGSSNVTTQPYGGLARGSFAFQHQEPRSPLDSPHGVSQPYIGLQAGLHAGSPGMEGLHGVISRISAAGSSHAAPSTLSTLHHTDLRAFTKSTAARPGLESGDVVLLRQLGRLYSVVHSAAPDQAGVAQYELDLITDPGREHAGTSEGGMQPAGASYLEVVRQGPYVGFRSAAAGRRFVQPLRKAPHRLLFFNTKLGVWEQWEVAGEAWQAPWSTLALVLRSRRLPQVELHVEMVRVGFYGTGTSASPTPRTMSVASETGSIARSLGVPEDENLRRISGLFMHEWFRFVDHEKRKQLEVDAQMRAMLGEMADFRMSTIAQVESIRSELELETKVMLEALQLRDRQLAACKRARRHAIESAIGAGWRKAGTALMRQVFTAWGQATAAKACLRTRMLRAIYVLSRSRMAAALEAWSVYAARRVGKRARVLRAVMWASRRLYRQALLGWAAAVAERREAAAAETCIAAAFRRRRLGRAALAAWQLHVQLRAGKARLVARSEGFHRMHMVRAGLCAWSQALHQGQMRRASMQRSVAWAAKRQLQAGLTAFKAAVERSLAREELGRELQAAGALSRCREVLRSWQDIMQARRQAVNVLDKLRLRMDWRLLKDSLAGWRSHVEAVQLAYQHADKLHARRTGAQASAVLNSWAGVVQQRRYRRGLVQRVLQRRGRALQAALLVAWADRVQQRKCQQAAVRRQLCRRALYLQGVAFDCWAAAVQQRRMHAAMERRQLQRRSAAVQAMAFSCWAGAAHQRRVQLAIVQRLVEDRAGAVQSSVFRHWAYVVQLHKVKMAVVEGQVQRQARALQAAVFGGWQDVVQQRTLQLVALQRHIKQRARSMQASALHRWVHVVQQRKVHEVAVQRRLQCRAWHTQAAVFTAWAELALCSATTAPGLLLSDIGEQAVRAMQQKRQLAVLRAWRQQGHDQEQAAALLAAAARRWEVAQVLRAVQQWHSIAELNTERRTLLVGALSKPSRLALSVMLGSWWSSKLPAAANLAAVDGQNTSSSYTTGNVDGVSKAAVSGGAKAGVDGMEATSGDIGQGAGPGSTTPGSVVPPSEQPLNRVAGNRRQQERDGDEQQVQHHGSEQWRWLLYAAFSGWQARAQGHNDRLDRAQQLSADVTRRQLHAVLNVWRGHALAHRALQQRAVHALRKLQGSRLRAAFDAWHMEAAWKATCAHQVRKLTAAWRARVLAAAWTALREHAAHQASTAMVAAAQLQGRQLAAVRHCLAFWQAWWRHKAQARVTVDQQRRRVRLRVLRGAFQVWVMRGQARAQREVTLADAQQRRQRHMQRRCLQTWNLLAVFLQQRRLSVGRLQERLRLRHLQHALDAWRLAVQQQLEHREQLRTCIRRKKIAFEHFKLWYWDSFDTEVQDTIRRVFQTTEGTMQDPLPSGYHHSTSPAGSPDSYAPSQDSPGYPGAAMVSSPGCYEGAQSPSLPSGPSNASPGYARTPRSSNGFNAPEPPARSAVPSTSAYLLGMPGARSAAPSMSAGPRRMPGARSAVPSTSAYPLGTPARYISSHATANYAMSYSTAALPGYVYRQQQQQSMPHYSQAAAPQFLSALQQQEQQQNQPSYTYMETEGGSMFPGEELPPAASFSRWAFAAEIDAMRGTASHARMDASQLGRQHGTMQQSTQGLTPTKPAEPARAAVVAHDAVSSMQGQSAAGASYPLSQPWVVGAHAGMEEDEAGAGADASQAAPGIIERGVGHVDTGRGAAHAHDVVHGLEIGGGWQQVANNIMYDDCSLPSDVDSPQSGKG